MTTSANAAPGADTSQAQYLQLLKRVLTRTDFPNSYSLVHRRPWRLDPRHFAFAATQRLLARKGYYLIVKGNDALRAKGDDWPSDAETMAGMARLDSLQTCIETILRDDIPGDLIETGVWRGGASIFMRGVLSAYAVADRTVWVADSFDGLPPPDAEKYPADANARFHQDDQLAVSLDEVKANFARYQLLDPQVQFLKGWFKDTLPDAPIDHLALIRLDGDMYESTVDAINSLYPKLSPGGFLIVDDYSIASCRQAVDEFRRSNSISDPIERIDRNAVLWRRSG
jgi:O-methyltransferase